MQRIEISTLFSQTPADGAVVTVCGWAKTVRDSKSIGFNNKASDIMLSLIA